MCTPVIQILFKGCAADHALHQCHVLGIARLMVPWFIPRLMVQHYECSFINTYAILIQAKRFIDVFKSCDTVNTYTATTWQHHELVHTFTMIWFLVTTTLCSRSTRRVSRKLWTVHEMVSCMQPLRTHGTLVITCALPNDANAKQ